MSDYNRAIVCGRLGRDAELRYTQSGTAVATISLATTETWKDKQSGQRQEKTEWHRVTLWGKAAEALQEFLRKGKQILVEGRLTTRKWTDKQGQDRYTTEIKADRVVLLGGAGNGDRHHGGRDDDQRVPDDEPAQSVRGGASDLVDDDIPFAWLLAFLAPVIAVLA